MLKNRYPVQKGTQIPTIDGLLNVISVDAFSGTALCHEFEFGDEEEDRLFDKGNRLLTANDIENRLHECDGRIYKVILMNEVRSYD